MTSANPFRAELADGSRIERAYRVETTASGKERRVGRGNWQWCVYDPDRRPARKRVNLRVKDKTAALSKASKLARQYAVGGLDPWADTASSGPASFESVVVRYLDEKRPSASAATIESDKGHLDRLSRLLPAGMSVRHVEARHVEAYVNADKPKFKNGTPRGPASPQTKARRRASLAHFFGWAVANGLCSSNPAEGVRLPRSTKARRDHVTDDEAAAILCAVTAAEVVSSARNLTDGKDRTFSGMDRSWIKDWIVFALGTGLRPGEQRLLRWSAVHLAERTIMIGKGHSTKTSAARRPVPVTGAALDVLERLRETRTTEDDGPVFTGAGGDRVAVDYLSDRLLHFAESAGVQKHVTAYSLRHSYGTKLVSAGVSLYEVARLLGTSVAMVERHYAHYSPDRAAAQVERVFGLNSSESAV